MALCERLKQFLDQEKVGGEVLPHHLAFTSQEVAASTHVPGRMLAKVVIVREGGGGYLMAVVPAPCRLDLTALEAAAGRRGLALAREDEFRSLFPDCETGAMPPFGNLYGLPVYVDSSLSRAEEFFFQGGNHQEVVRMRYADYERLVRPMVGNLCLPAS